MREPEAGRNPRRRWGRRRHDGGDAGSDAGDRPNGAVVSDSHVEIELDEATGMPRLRIVEGRRTG